MCVAELVCKQSSVHRCLRGQAKIRLVSRNTTIPISYQALPRPACHLPKNLKPHTFNIASAGIAHILRRLLQIPQPVSALRIPQPRCWAGSRDRKPDPFDSLSHCLRPDPPVCGISQASREVTNHQHVEPRILRSTTSISSTKVCPPVPFSL